MLSVLEIPLNKEITAVCTVETRTKVGRDWDDTNVSWLRGDNCMLLAHRP